MALKIELYARAGTPQAITVVELVDRLAEHGTSDSMILDCHDHLASFVISATEVIVLRPVQGNKATPYVVHSFNPNDGGYYHGDYCADLQQATRAFINRLSRRAGI